MDAQLTTDSSAEDFAARCSSSLLTFKKRAKQEREQFYYKSQPKFLESQQWSIVSASSADERVWPFPNTHNPSQVSFQYKLVS